MFEAKESKVKSIYYIWKAPTDWWSRSRCSTRGWPRIPRGRCVCGGWIGEAGSTWWPGPGGGGRGRRSRGRTAAGQPAPAVDGQPYHPPRTLPQAGRAAQHQPLSNRTVRDRDRDRGNNRIQRQIRRQRQWQKQKHRTKTNKTYRGKY